MSFGLKEFMETEIVQDENGVRIVNPYYLFIRFLSSYATRAERIEWYYQTESHDSDTKVHLIIGLKSHAPNLVGIGHLSLLFIAARLREFLSQSAKACVIQSISDPFYWQENYEGSITFCLSPDFAWENLTKGIAPGDIIGFCTPEEEAALEPHLYDIEVEMVTV